MIMSCSCSRTKESYCLFGNSRAVKTDTRAESLEKSHIAPMWVWPHKMLLHHHMCAVLWWKRPESSPAEVFHHVYQSPINDSCGGNWQHTLFSFSSDTFYFYSLWLCIMKSYITKKQVTELWKGPQCSIY